MMDATSNPVSASTDSLEVWFQRVHSQIGVVERMTLSTEGALFFKEHTYTKEEILASPEMAKVESYIMKIEDDFNRWMENSAISDERAKFYWENRLKVERSLGELRAKIYERKPKFWEAIVQLVTKVINMVKEHLPMLPQLIMQRLGFAQQRSQLKMLEVNDDDI